MVKTRNTGYDLILYSTDYYKDLLATVNDKEQAAYFKDFLNDLIKSGNLVMSNGDPALTVKVEQDA